MNRPAGHPTGVTDASALADGPLAASKESDPTRERLSSLVTEHFDFVWRLVRRLGIAHDDADDAAQQVFMTVVRRVDAIEAGRERAYLYSTALRITANLRRGMRRRREHVDSDLDSVAARDMPPDRNAELAQACEILDQILDRLPDPLRAILILVEMEGLEVAQAASLEKIPPGTAASRLRKARELFQNELRNLGERHPFAEKGDLARE
jgi:RNA polymerase sigma-70 factor, ECF subfamily